jgi:phospholipid/cholesterol/gamma-HCH transport system permease protein
MRFEGGTLHLEGELSRETVPALLRDLSRTDLRTLRAIDLAGVAQIDSSGVAFIEETRARAEGPVELVNVREEPARAIDVYSPRVPPEAPQAGEQAEELGLRAAAGRLILLSADVLSGCLAALVGRGRHRRGAVVEQGVAIGFDAVPILMTLSVIIGLILGLQSAAQLRLVGANVFVADLLAIALVREMAAMMTAIIVAGRSGSAIASEIATMGLTEEIDALHTMGIDPIRYVVVPKTLAMFLCLPLLVAISIAVGMFGGLIVAVTYLSLPAVTFLNRAVAALKLSDILIGIGKSLVFAPAILIIAAFCGLEARGGPEAVGQAATRAVVGSIFAVILIDVFFSLLYLPA